MFGLHERPLTSLMLQHTYRVMVIRLLLLLPRQPLSVNLFRSILEEGPLLVLFWSFIVDINFQPLYL